jgi:hypothetical protein
MTDRKYRPSGTPILVGLSLGALLGSASGFLAVDVHIWALGVFHRVYPNDITEGIRYGAGICCGWVVGAGVGAGVGWLIRSLRGGGRVETLSGGRGRCNQSD